MPKQLITVIGLIVSLGVVALGVFLVAAPLYLQSIATDQQTASVANTNAIYQAQVDALLAESERQGEIDASVATLRSQIPALPQLDGVFEVVGRAAEATGASIQEITAGVTVPFEPRTSADVTTGATPSLSSEPEGETGAPGDASTDDATEQTDSMTSETGGTGSEDASSTGREQIDFTIRVAASDMNQAMAFLDALRAGPRLLNSVKAITGMEPSGTVTLRISALTYVDAEG